MPRKYIAGVLFVAVALGGAACTRLSMKSVLQQSPSSQTNSQTTATLDGNPQYRDVAAIPGVRILLKYATEDNFTGENLYGDFRRCFLHVIAWNKLKLAGEYLREERPDLSFLVYDGLRPRSVQRRMWEKVRGGPEQAYVADPERGSVHNFGLALDLTLQDAAGRPLDMGTPFDSFTPLSEPHREEEMLRSGKLTTAQLENRLLLRRVMTRAGFIQLPNEWWHFDALPSYEARRGFRIIE